MCERDRVCVRGRERVREKEREREGGETVKERMDDSERWGAGVETHFQEIS